MDFSGALNGLWYVLKCLPKTIYWAGNDILRQSPVCQNSRYHRTRISRILAFLESIRLQNFIDVCFWYSYHYSVSLVDVNIILTLSKGGLSWKFQKVSSIFTITSGWMWKKNTLRNYEFILDNFQNHFGDIELSSITSENILIFTSEVSDGTKQNTKKLRFTLLAAFFNFIKTSVNPDLQSPCDNPALRKLFKASKPTQFKILEKDVVDEIIFRTRNPRNRLMLELQETGWCSN